MKNKPIKYSPPRYKRSIAAEARHRAMKLAAKRKRPYRGKYPVHTEYGIVPSYESEFALAKQIRHKRRVFEEACEYHAKKGFDLFPAYEEFHEDGGLFGMLKFIEDEE